MSVRNLLSVGRACTMAVLVAAMSACEGPKAHHTSTELSPVHYTYIYLFDNYELAMYITPDGAISARQQTGNMAADVTRATGQITPEQKSAFWSGLSGLVAAITPFFPQIGVAGIAAQIVAAIFGVMGPMITTGTTDATTAGQVTGTGFATLGLIGVLNWIKNCLTPKEVQK